MYKYKGELMPRRIINEKMEINHKRAAYLLEKFSNKGWYDYGVSLDKGWLTEEGLEYIKNNVIPYDSNEVEVPE